MEEKNSPLLCDPVTGFCEIPASAVNQVPETVPAEKPIKIIYFTDPICSSCWGIEPQLRKLKLEYESSIEWEYRMGGLLPDWTYNSGGISKPSDVAHHWDEVSVYYDMPIDGDVWLEDPLHSSYPPSVAFKAAHIQDKEKAILFLRAIREKVFLQKKNITRAEMLEEAAREVGLNVEQFNKDVKGKANALFEEDLKLAKESGVRGFPTMFFVDASGNRETVYGVKPYSVYESTILKLNPLAVKYEYERNWQALFSKYSSLTAKEFSELMAKPRGESEILLNELSEKGILEKLTTKNGAIWKFPAN